jgi:hypothetical protein
MAENLHSRLKNGTAWRACVCLLLAALFLYNPFFTIFGSSNDPIVRHPLSYRATVAGSELQRGSFESAKSLMPGVILDVTRAWSLFAPVPTILPARPDNSRGAASPLLSEDLWFRPPPVL